MDKVTTKLLRALKIMILFSKRGKMAVKQSLYL